MVYMKFFVIKKKRRMESWLLCCSKEIKERIANESKGNSIDRIFFKIDKISKISKGNDGTSVKCYAKKKPTKLDRNVLRMCVEQNFILTHPDTVRWKKNWGNSINSFFVVKTFKKMFTDDGHRTMIIVIFHTKNVFLLLFWRRKRKIFFL